MKGASQFTSMRVVTHLEEWLDNIQGKNNQYVCDDDICHISEVLRHKQIKDITAIDQTMIRNILKELKFFKYYEYTPYIWNKITNLPNPEFPLHVVDTLKNMFGELRMEYSGRSLPSTSYLVHKMLGILGESDLMKKIPLVKSQQKLCSQELIWKNICDFHGWKYISSSHVPLSL
jgi:hypothetical protein